MTIHTPHDIAQQVTLHADHLESEAADIETVVVLPTFRRPEQLKTTLASLQSQRFDGEFAVIVVENDAEGMQGAQSAAAFLECSQLNGIVIITHQRGNCHAYNGGFQAARRLFRRHQLIAIIDDDEIASPDWLANHKATLAETGADFSGGPQLPIFETDTHTRRQNHPAFKPHYAATGPVDILYSSGNVMFRSVVLDAMPEPFLEPAFNFIGGGDSDFYRRCKRAGFSFAWCAEASVDETVPTRRLEVSWLNARSLRTGAISTLIEHRENSSLPARLRTLAKSFALLAVSPWRGLKLLLASGSPVIALFHTQVAMGRLMAEFGRINEQYRNPEAN